MIPYADSLKQLEFQFILQRALALIHGDYEAEVGHPINPITAYIDQARDLIKTERESVEPEMVGFSMRGMKDE